MTTPSALSTRVRSPPKSILSSTAVQLGIVISLGTLYSILFNTALDTSNPLLANLPTRHDGQTSYLAQKSNVLNTLFVKKAWGWTTAAFVGVLATAPPGIARRERRVARWAATTAVWMIFAGWFFGPSLFDRIAEASGGQCVVHVPLPSSSSYGGANAGNPDLGSFTPTYVEVPSEYCRSRAVLSPSAFRGHPEVLSALASALSLSPLSSDPSGGGSSVAEENIVLETLKLKPRLYRGHDVSGHLFLLSLSILFLVDQLRPSLRLLRGTSSSPPPSSSSSSSSSSPPTSSSDPSPPGSGVAGSEAGAAQEKQEQEKPSQAHIYAVLAASTLNVLWFVMAVSTSVYFHTPFEKVSGFGEYFAVFTFSITPCRGFLLPGSAGFWMERWRGCTNDVDLI